MRRESEFPMSGQERILEYMRKRRAEMTRDLMRLARIPSVQAEGEQNAPFGRECARCLREAAALFRENGFEVREYPDSGYALCEMGKGDRCVGLFAHLDVVPANEADWLLTRPFEPVEQDGFLIGRGVNDNKNGAIAALYLMKAVRELQLPLNGRLLVFLGTNEESGMKDVAAFVREQPLPDASLVPDSGFPLSLGERGILRADVTAERPLRDVLELNGGKAYNTVLSSLVCRVKKSERRRNWLEAHARAWLTVTEEEDALRLEARGVAAHAGHPADGENALARLCGLLQDCEELCEADRELLRAVARLLSDTDGTALGIAGSDPVLGRLTAANGIARLDGGRLTFTLDVRHGESVTGEELLGALSRTLAPQGFSIRMHSDARAFTIAPDDPLAQALLAAYRKASGDREREPYYMNGGTYCKYLPHAFATGTNRHAGPYLTLPKGHGNAHEADECLSVEGWINGCAILCGMALELDACLGASPGASYHEK